jgi:hypothetical protein
MDRSCVCQDHLGLSIDILVLPNFVVPFVGNGMPTVECDIFQMFFFSNLLVHLYLCNHICSCQSYSNVRICSVAQYTEAYS